MEVDPLTPTVIAPLVHDGLSIEDLLLRKDEKTTVRFEEAAPHTVYLEYRENLPMLLGPKDSVQSKSIAQAVAVGAPMAFELTFHPKEFFYDNMYDVQQVTIKSCQPQVCLRYDVEESAKMSDIESLAGSKVTGEYSYPDADENTWYKFEQSYIAPGKTFGPKNSIKSDNQFDAHSEEGAIDAKTFKKVTGIRVKFRNIKLENAPKMAGKTFHFRALFKATHVVLSEAIGSLVDANVQLNKEFKKQKDVDVDIPIFDYTSTAEVSFPESKIYAQVEQAEGCSMSIKVNDVVVEQRVPKSGQGTLDVQMEENTRKLELVSKGQGDPAVAIHISDDIPNVFDQTQQTRELNYENSNMEELLRGGFSKVSLKYNYAIGGVTVTDNKLPTNGKFTFGMKMPLYGWINHNSTMTTMTVDGEAFPDSVRDHLNDRSSDEVVKLIFVFSNGLPLNMYAKLVFVGEDGKPVLEVKQDAEDAEGNPIQIPDLNQRMIFVQSAKVDAAGLATDQVLTKSIMTLTYDEYTRLTKAKNLKVYFDMKTPGVENKKNVRFVKENRLNLTIAVEVKAKLDISEKDDNNN